MTVRTLLWIALAVEASAQVSADRIRDADREPGNWLTYSRTYNGQRYTPLKEITTANVERLRPAWVHQIQQPGKFSTSPIVIDGILYITEPGGEVVALDGRTGRPLWRFGRRAPPDLRACCGSANRGLAVLHDLLFVGTLDAHLLAIDLQTGKLRWDTVVTDYRTGHAITGAPLAYGDKVLVGVAGGEYGIRGFVDAYDANSGRRVWRFWTVPGPGEPGNDSWQGDSWKTGGASTWITGSYDPVLNLVYWGTGNPGPDYNGDARKGDNLYSCSLVAIDANNGKLRWLFNSRRTTSTIGIQRTCPCLSMMAKGSSSSFRTETGSITFSTVRRVVSSAVRNLESRPGLLDWTPKAVPFVFPIPSQRRAVE